MNENTKLVCPQCRSRDLVLCHSSGFWGTSYNWVCFKEGMELRYDIYQEIDYDGKNGCGFVTPEGDTLKKSIRQWEIVAINSLLTAPKG